MSSSANTKKRKDVTRRERIAALRARQKRAERRRNLITLGAIGGAAAVIIGAVAGYAAGRGRRPRGRAGRRPSGA